MESVKERIIETYDPRPSQKLFHSGEDRNKLFGGSMGSGKTRSLCEDINALMTEFPGNRGLIIRKVLADFKLTTYVTLVEKTLAPYLSAGLIKEKKADRYFEYWNKSRLYYGGLDASSENKERSKYFSGEYGAIAADEGRELEEKDFKELSTRLRHRLPDGKFPPYFFLLASNPSQNWLKKLFILRPESGYKFYPALPKDNIHNPADYVDHLRDLFKNDEKLLQAYVEGNWDSVVSIDDLIGMADLQPVIEVIGTGPKISPFAPRLTSVDPARFGDDSTVIYDFAGNKVVKQEKYGKKDLMETVGRVTYHVDTNHSTHVILDPIGMEGLGDRLREIFKETEKKVLVTDCDFREHSSDKSKWVNVRAEVYMYFRKMVINKQCRVPDDLILHGQACSIKYKFVGGGKYGFRTQIEPKADIKKRLGGSPDELDSYVMGLFGQQRTLINREKAWRDTYKQDNVNKESFMSA